MVFVHGIGESPHLYKGHLPSFVENEILVLNVTILKLKVFFGLSLGASIGHLFLASKVIW